MKKNQITPTCCFAPTTQILMADGSQKYINEVKIGDKIASINGETKEVGCDAQNQAEEYFILKTEQGHEIEITGDHPVLTDDGWKQVKSLALGDKVACQEQVMDAYYYDEVTVLECRTESREMYNLICDECAMIANGIVCGDFHIQYDLLIESSILERIKAK